MIVLARCGDCYVELEQHVDGTRFTVCVGGGGTAVTFIQQGQGHRPIDVVNRLRDALTMLKAVADGT